MHPNSASAALVPEEIDIVANVAQLQATLRNWENKVPATSVTMTTRGRQSLEEMARDSRVPSSLRTRARIALLADEGWLNVQIAAELKVSIGNVATWRNRYARYGAAGLRNKPCCGRPRQVDRAMIVAETLKPPPEELGLRRWTIRELGRHVGVAEATVARAWREYGVSPREGGALAFATQPGLSANTVEIVGLHGTSRVRAVALLVDPVGPAGSARAAGSLSVNGRPDPSVRPGDHVQFLNRVAHAYPGRPIDLVLDGAAAVRQLRMSDASALHPQVRYRFTLGPDIWLRLVGVWAQMMVRDGSDQASNSLRQLDLLRAGGYLTWIAPAPVTVESDRSTV